MIFKQICFTCLLIKCVISVEAISNGSTPETTSKFLQKHSILFELSIFAQNNSQISSTCSHQFEQIRQNNLNKIAWAMKMLDASGRKLPGFMFGQEFWLGDREVCRAVKEPLKLDLTKRYNGNIHWSVLNETAPFDVDFFVAYLMHKSPWQVDAGFLPTDDLIQLGLCAPAACQIKDLKILLGKFLMFHANDDFYDLQANIFYIKRPRYDWLPSSRVFKNPNFIILASVCGLTLLLMLTAAILKWNPIKMAPLFQALIKCFDVTVNANKIFNKHNDDISVINGLRVVVSIIIVFIHVIFFTTPVVSNLPMILSYVANKRLLIAHLTVDFFFTISGFLQAHKFLSSPKELKSIREANAFNVFKEFTKKLFHRWLRLAPLFYIVVLLDVSLVIFLHERSVYNIVFRDDLSFSYFWWRYLLFINNFIDATVMAANWTWSMGCEMQFFIFGTLLLFLYAKNRNIAKICFLLLLFGNFGFYYYNGIMSEYGFNHDDFLPNANAVYLNSLVRCTPYLLGMLCGWYLADPQRRYNGLVERLIGNCAFLVLILLFILLHFGEVAHGAAATTVLLTARIAVSLWICWLILAALTQRKTWLSPLMELNCFRPLAKLSYAFYLIHPCIIIFVAYTTDIGMHLDSRIVLILHLGFVCASYFAAVICSLAFELPYCNLSSLIIKRKS